MGRADRRRGVRGVTRVAILAAVALALQACAAGAPDPDLPGRVSAVEAEVEALGARVGVTESWGSPYTWAVVDDVRDLRDALRALESRVGALEAEEGPEGGADLDEAWRRIRALEEAVHKRWGD